MNKKVLSAILFSALFAGTGTFTSCIDNDEPAGIEELRGAKAELLKAKVAVEQANAAYKLAEAELVKAQAAVQDAIAEQNKALAENQKLQNELLAIQNDSAKAELEKQLAENEMELDSLQKAHEEAMYTIQTTLAKAKRSYELALAQIEIAKAINSENGGITIFALENAVTTAKTALDTAEAEFNAATQELWAAQADARYNTVNLKRYELSLAQAKADLEIKNATLAKWNAFAEEDETADWRAEIAEIEDSLVQIGKEKAKLELEKQQALNSKDFKAYVDTVYAAEKALTLEQDSLALLALTEDLVDTLLYYVTTEEGKKVTKLGYEVKIEKDTKLECLAFETSSGKKASCIEHGAGSIIGGENFMDVTDGKYEGLLGELAAQKATYTTEKQYWLDSVAKIADKTAADQAAAIEKVVKGWETALAAYNSAKAISTAAMDNGKTGDDAAGAYYTYLSDIEEANKLADASKKAVAIAKAKEKFADAVVAFYNGLPSSQVGVVSITLEYTSGKTATKTVKDWLSNADYKADYLDLVIEYFDDNAKKLWAVNSVKEETLNQTTGIAEKKLDGAFSKWVEKRVKAQEVDENGNKVFDKEGNPVMDTENAKTTDKKTSLYGQLVAASVKAYGDASLYVGADAQIVGLQDGYLHKKPTDADVEAVGYNVAGEYGAYLAALNPNVAYEAKNYKAIMADLDAAITYWTAELTKIIATIEAAEEDVESAKDALKLAQDNLQAYSDGITETQNLALYELGGEERALTAIKDALIAAVEAFIGDQTVYTDKTGFAQWLAKKVNDAQEAVFSAETNVIARENDLAKMTEGYDRRTLGVELAEERLADATEALSEAQADLDEALANLAKGLEILAATNGVSAE